MTVPHNPPHTLMVDPVGIQLLSITFLHTIITYGCSKHSEVFNSEVDRS